MKNKIKALIFDIDDTLIKKGDEFVEESAIIAIQKAKEKGVITVVATGRGYSFMHPDVKNRVQADYYVTVNGTSITRSNGDIVRNVPISTEDVDRLITRCDELGYYYGIKCAKRFVTYRNYDEFTDHYCNKAVTKDMIVDMSSNTNYHKTDDDPLDVFILSKNREAMELQSEFENLKFYKVFESDCECSNKNMNKGKALQELMDSLNIPLENCMAFGDADNDVDMLKMCGIGVAMGNANENCKRAADYITDDIKANGIYNALKHFEIIE